MTEHQFPLEGPERDPLIGVTRRAVSALVLWLWSVLRWRSEADRWYVYVTALASANEKAAGRTEAHLRVLFRFVEATDGAPLSRRSYTRFRDAQPDRDGLPSATAIANTFGGWPRAAEAIGQTVTPDVLARRLTATGPRLTRDALVDVLKAWIATTPTDLHYRTYRRWAFAQNENPTRSLGVIPVARMTFHNYFGGWWEALHAAGAIDDAELEQRKTLASPHNPRVSPDDILAWLRDIAATVAPRRLTADAYEVARNRLLEAGEPAPPAMTTVLNRFGTWHEALGAAGLIDDEHVAAGLRKGGRRAPDTHVLISLRRATASLGPDMTRRRYRAWRLRQLEAGVKPAPVSDGAIVARFGGWPAAVNAALEAR